MIVVLADDLSGAAEIGGIAWRHGLTAEIQHELDVTADVDLVIVNTNTRASSPRANTRRIEESARRGRAAGIEQFFIKVDSVLRGHVLTDLTAAMTGLGRQRTLLAPANPGLGRTIEQGIYRLNGTPLHETQFAHDPDFPATTAWVASLLRARNRDQGAVNAPPVTVHAPGDPLPEQGVIVGEAVRRADLTTWAKATDAATLPAGAAEFFAAYLRAHGHRELKCAPSRAIRPRPQLFICGSASTATQEFCRQAATAGVPLLAMPQALFDGTGDDDGKLLGEWADATIAALAHRPRAIIAINRPMTEMSHDPEQLTQLLGAAAARILTGLNVGEIFTEGGATAAAVINAQGWSRLRVEEELAPGVVRTRPAEASDLRFTVKPGSYIWPARIRISDDENLC